MRRSGWLAVALCVALSAAWPAGELRAEEARHVYWRVDSALTGQQAERFERALKLVLGRVQGQNLLTERALGEHIRERTVQIPLCYDGSQPCEQPQVQLARALSVDGLVSVEARSEGGAYDVTLRFWRSTGGTPTVLQGRGAEPEEVLRELIGQVFTLEALLTIRTEPAAATVFINGNLAGDAPLEKALGEGRHTLRVEAAGYEALRESVALRPGERRELVLRLQPKLTQLTVLTSAPGAEVFVDAMLRGPAGEPHDVAPGEHRVEVRAPGHHAIGQQVQINAAERRTLQFALLREAPDPWTLRERGVRPHRAYLRPYLGLTSQAVDFDGEVVVDGVNVSPTGYDGASRASLTRLEVGVAAGWTARHFGLVVLDVGLAWAGVDGAVDLESDAGLQRAASSASTSRVSLRPLQGTARYLRGPFSVEGITGLGVGFDTLTMRGGSLDGEVEIDETRLFWRLGAEARYHWASEWYVGVGYGLEVDFGGARGVRHGLQVGVGFFLPILMAGEGDEERSDPLPDRLPEDEDDADDEDDEGEAAPDGEALERELDSLQDTIERERPATPGDAPTPE